MGAAHDGEAKGSLAVVAFARLTVGLTRPLTGAAIAPGLLQGGLVRRRPDGRAGAQIGVGMAALAAFTDPRGELARVKVGIAIVDEGRRRAVLEFDVRRPRALRPPGRVPDAGHRAHASHHPAADEADDIDLVGPLVVHDVAALSGIELLRHARSE